MCLKKNWQLLIKKCIWGVFRNNDLPPLTLLKVWHNFKDVSWSDKTVCSTSSSFHTLARFKFCWKQSSGSHALTDILFRCKNYSVSASFSCCCFSLWILTFNFPFVSLLSSKSQWILHHLNSFWLHSNSIVNFFVNGGCYFVFCIRNFLMHFWIVRSNRINLYEL